MANLSRTFHNGRMNKTLNERLIPAGEYVDATNIRVSSSEGSEGGVVENAKGNIRLTDITIDGQSPTKATCIGSFEDGANETIYWFVTSKFNSAHTSDKADFILSYNMLADVMTYHVISMQDPNNADQSVLNFSEEHLINSIDLVGDMLFFTDGFNPPRKINVKKSYPRPQFLSSYMDTVSAEEYMVIKKPPVEAPSLTNIVGIRGGDSEDWFKDKFISFAYRYKYDDGEYSATSQFTPAAFVPDTFEIDGGSATNIGASNIVESVRIDYETGDKTVVGIDILYKDMDDNIIKVADKIDKAVDGITDNTTNTYVFSGSKLYTVLPESEILRLYDNVPLTAKAQTIMSNRLFYGNYVEGYDMVDENNDDVRIEYKPYRGGEEVTGESVPSEVGDNIISYDGSTYTADATVFFDLSNIELIRGTFLDFTFAIQGGPKSSGLQSDPSVSLAFSYELQQDFDSLAELVDNDDFKSRIGTISSINMDNPCSGSTLFDAFYCYPDADNSGKEKFDVTSLIDVQANSSGYTGPSDATSEILRIKFPAVLYAVDPDNPTNIRLQSFDVSFPELSISRRRGSGSLKSNRNYEVGMVYMDDFGRSTTALVSSESSLNVPIDKSASSNFIKVKIPTTQKPPKWATRYKFVIKQDEDDYNTIFSDIYYKDSKSKYSYFLVEGENAAKVQEGDVLIVKSDKGGPLDVVTKVTVLEKKAQEEGFITAEDTAGNAVDPIAGVYIKLLADTFSATEDGATSYSPTFDEGYARWVTREQDRYAIAYVGPFRSGGEDIPIVAGTRIKMQVRFTRAGSGDGEGGCERRNYTLDIDKVSPVPYPNFRSWWNGEQIYNLLDDGVQDVGAGGSDVANQMVNYNDLLNTYQFNNAEEYNDGSAVTGGIPGSEITNKWGWVDWQGSGYDDIRLGIKGTKACGLSVAKSSYVKGYVKIISPNGGVVFETEATPAMPDIWYENEQSFPIVNGFHETNYVNQTNSTDGRATLTFQNCISFGNGVESYRINDSIVGRKMKLGNRVTSTQAQDYKQAHRFADLTYSGVINDESNINRLNEFNGGLLNFKACEDSFGPIEVIDARRTDILVLQEDKVSTVLAGKNLLSMSDSVKGGALASVPEVLGQQVARQEDYGISNNPESYCSFGGSKYFTDVKRGAVLQMTGEQLLPISEMGMADFFREQFIQDSETYKLGGYDPYMDEYVLANLESSGSGQSTAIECGRRMSLQLTAGEVFTLEVEYGNELGAANNVISMSSGDIDVEYQYGTNVVDLGNFGFGIHTLSPIDKNSRAHTSITFTITANSDSTVEWEASCLETPVLNVIRVVVNDNAMAGKIAQPEHSWNEGSYVSPTSTTYATLVEDASSNTVVSKWDLMTGNQGEGVIPGVGADVTMYLRDNGVSNVRFDANANNKFMALKTNTLFTPADINTILANATDLGVPGVSTDENGDVVHQRSFTLSETPSDNYLYLVYDLRSYYQTWISFGSDKDDACCNITCAGGTGNYKVVNGSATSINVQYETAGGATLNVTIGGGGQMTLISATEPIPSVVSDKIKVELTSCN